MKLNFKKKYGLTENQALVLVAMLRYFRWWSIDEGKMPVDEKTRIANKRKNCASLVRYNIGRIGNGILTSYYFSEQKVTGKHLDVFWGKLRLRPSYRNSNRGLTMLNLSHKNYTRSWGGIIDSTGSHEFFSLTQEGIIMATLLEVTLQKSDLIWEFPHNPKNT